MQVLTYFLYKSICNYLHYSYVAYGSHIGDRFYCPRTLVLRENPGVLILFQKQIYFSFESLYFEAIREYCRRAFILQLSGVGQS